MQSPGIHGRRRTGGTRNSERIKSAQTGHLLEFIATSRNAAADVLKSDTERWRVSLFGIAFMCHGRRCEAGKRTTTESLKAMESG